VGLWTRQKLHEKNALEREIAGYETVIFPRRPPEMDEAYHQRMKESLERRKQKTRVPEDKRKRGRVNAKRSNKKKKAPPLENATTTAAGDEEQDQHESEEDPVDAAPTGEKVEEGNTLSLIMEASASSDDDEEEKSESSPEPNKE
jgi:hypothetical protein